MRTIVRTIRTESKRVEGFNAAGQLAEGAAATLLAPHGLSSELELVAALAQDTSYLSLLVTSSVVNEHRWRPLPARAVLVFDLFTRRTAAERTMTYLFTGSHVLQNVGAFLLVLRLCNDTLLVQTFELLEPVFDVRGRPVTAGRRTTGR